MKVYVPTNYGKCMRDVNQLHKEINSTFGGSTVYDATGSWYNDKAGKVEVEPVKVFEIGYGQRGQPQCIEKDQAKKYAEAVSKYAVHCNQQEISITDEGEFFIGGTTQLARSASKLYDVPRFRKRKKAT